MLYHELRCKEVINMRDCKCLGRVVDFEFDECSGCIRKIFVRGKVKTCKLFHTDGEICINYKEIRQMGPDIILVDINF